jgi:hypothetical protein
MIQRKYAVLIAFAMLAVAASLSGCGSAHSDAVSPGQSQAAKAQVTVAVKFPSADGAVKSLIPAGAQVIEVRALPVPYTYDPNNPNGVLIATLTPAVPSTTIQINPGNYLVVAQAYTSADINTRMIAGQTSTGGEIKSGQANTIVLTFLDGQWTIVNSTDVPTPIVLKNGTSLKDFIISSSQQMGKAGKSLIDSSKPVGGGGGMVRLRFSNFTSARINGGMVSQFIGTTSTTILNGGSYNMTKQCGFYNYYNIPCDDGAGDQIIRISGKDNGGDYQSGGYYEGEMLYGSAKSLLPGGGMTFTQNGTPLDLTAAMPDTLIAKGNTITGGIIEWLPATVSINTLGMPPVGKAVKRSEATKAAQSTNSEYLNISVKSYEPKICSGTNPQNRGTWTFANNTSAGKIVLGGRVCYNPDSTYLESSNPVTGQNMNSGDYSYGLVPANNSDLGDYCHVWSYSTNMCSQRLPMSGDVYYPDRFVAAKSAMKTSISYGSFKFNFWLERSQTGNAYIYPFKAKGSTVVLPAQ